jgi:methionyl-tRNA synthetase
MTKPFYITTPIYYVNDVPHIGHAYTSLACDTMARFARMDGRPVWFLTGTDEHGQKIEKTAHSTGISPQELVDKISKNFREMSARLNLTNDDFIRTTELRHTKGVAALWQKLLENGSIYLGAYKGWYSVRDEAFYAESELVDGKAPTGAPVEWLEEPSYFFKLSAFGNKLLEHYKSHPDFIAPASRRNEVMRFVEGGLEDLSVSRTSFSWGVPVPGDPKHVVYVWLDALTNYMTALGYPTETLEFKKFWPEALHVVGKDILRFHAVFWPAFLMAADLPLPKKIFAHGWWTNEGQKISKSLGNAIDPYALVQTYGLDAVRYFMMREIPFGQDGDFSKSHMIQRINGDLANDWGNLCQRVLSFIHKNAGAIVPTPGEFTEEDQKLLDDTNEVLVQGRHCVLEEQTLHRYLEDVWRIIGAANRYVDYQAPWSLKKTDLTRMNTVLYVLVEVIRKVALLTSPVMPDASEKIMDQLNVPERERTFANFDSALVPGTPLPTPVGVFPRYKENDEEAIA